MSDRIVRLLREASTVVKANEFTVDDLPSAFKTDPIGYLDGLSERLEKTASEIEEAEPVAYAFEDRLTGELGGYSTCNHSSGMIPLYRRSHTSTVPEGWKIVPVEPTDDMIIASQRYVHSYDVRLIYKHAVASAPNLGDKQ